MRGITHLPARALPRWVAHAAKRIVRPTLSVRTARAPVARIGGVRAALAFVAVLEAFGAHAVPAHRALMPRAQDGMGGWRRDRWLR